MKELVFLKPIGGKMEAYTTTAIVSECVGVSQKYIKRAVTSHKNNLEMFGKVGAYATTLESGQRATGYMLNEQQATFLMTLLKNTPAVVEFKAELVRQFYAMREELQKRREIRQAGKPIRRSLTDALRDSGENERLHGQGYSLYTNMLYKSVTGRNARQLQQARGAAGRQAADLLTARELEKYKKREAVAAALLDAGMNYEGIRQILEGIA